MKAPFAQAAVGPAPTDRGKQGTKRSLLCDRRGIPLALVIEGANRHDRKVISATLDAQRYERPEPTGEQPQNLCLDAGYDDDVMYADLYLRGYEPHAPLNPHNHKWYQEALKQQAQPTAWRRPRSPNAGSWSDCSPGSIVLAGS